MVVVLLVVVVVVIVVVVHLFFFFQRNYFNRDFYCVKFEEYCILGCAML